MRAWARFPSARQVNRETSATVFSTQFAGPRPLLANLSAIRRADRLARARVRCSGRADEWHLDFAKAFRHLAFDFGAWLVQPVVVIAPAFFHAWFVAIRSVSDSMSGDGIEEVLIHAQALGGISGSAKLDQRLESFQGLHGSLEADGPWQNIVFCRSLGHDGADEVLGQDMRPNLFSHQRRRLAA